MYYKLNPVSNMVVDYVTDEQAQKVGLDVLEGLGYKYIPALPQVGVGGHIFYSKDRGFYCIYDNGESTGEEENPNPPIEDGGESLKNMIELYEYITELNYKLCLLEAEGGRDIMLFNSLFKKYEYMQRIGELTPEYVAKQKQYLALFLSQELLSMDEYNELNEKLDSYISNKNKEE